MSVSVNELEKFIVDVQPDLEKIKRELSAFNIFSVLKIEHREIRHSNFLGWLFDPNESHEMGDIFLKDLFKLMRSVGALESNELISLLLQDLSNTQVHREKDDIDILIVNENLGFVVCIENKVNAKYDDEQLEKYYKNVERMHSGIRKRIYLTLTPHRNEMHLIYEHGDKYKNISYQEIVNILRSNFETIETANPTVKESINQYIAMIEKRIIRNSEEVKLAQEIYRKYKDEIEFIRNNKPNFQASKEYINAFINSGGLGGFDTIKNEPHNDIIRILPKGEEIKTIFKDDRFKSWGGEYFFCIELFVYQEHIFLKWAFGDVRSEDIELRSKKDKIFKAMYEFECFKNTSLEITMLSDTPSDGFPGICVVNLFEYETYLKQDKDLLEFLKEEFNKVNTQLIEPWTKECIEIFNDDFFIDQNRNK